VVIQHVRQLVPEITDAKAHQVDAEARAELGGLRVRIPKRGKHPSAEKRKAIFKEAMSNASDAEITERHGIHRATLYRMLKRGSGEG
jgi:transcriptional regulator of acetoin/glycerol metabolism